MKAPLNNWKHLPTYQKIKYAVEIIAICGGLVLILVNVFQVRLLSEQNTINRELIRTTFPIEIESDVIEISDKQSITLKVRLTNIGNQRLYIQTWLPKIVRSGSNNMQSALQEITTKIYKEYMTKSIPAPREKEKKVILKPSESCILELSVELNIPAVFSDKDIFKNNKPEYVTFIVLPLTLFSIEQQSSRTLLVSLSRDKKKSLMVSSDISRVTDDETILQIIRIERSRLSVSELD